MTVVGVTLIWLALAAVAFLALSAFARFAAHGEAELGIAGETDAIDTSYMR